MKLALKQVLLCLLLPFLSIAQSPTDITISNNNIPENEELMTFIGTLSAVDANQASGHEFVLLDGEKDNHYFNIQQDSLYSYFSFNFENQNAYQIMVKARDNDGNVFLKNLNIQITDVTGKYDQNGVADADIANKYPQVNVGDYIYFNGVGTNDAIYAQNNGFPNVSYPNKVLIRGDRYRAISFGLSQINGNSPTQRIPIANFLGQVYTNSIYLRDGSNWRISGRYEPSTGLGSPYYTGCDQQGATEDYGFSHQQFGIWISREWEDEGTNLLSVSGTATGFEVDHIEISDGGFSGLMLKYDNNNVHTMTDVEVHHMYIHDIGSEGMYIGSTQSEPQHPFENLHIHHCAVLRVGGEAIQIGQQSAGALVEHNVLWGAFDWLSPFQQWQDNIFQLDARNGDITIRNNVLMGAAGNAFSAFNRTKTGITPNGQPIRIENNLIWCSRGRSAAYQGGPGDNVTPWVWRNNYWGKFIYDYDRVYTNNTNHPHILLVGIQNSNIRDTIEGNVYDTSKTNFHTLWGGGTVQITASNNTQSILEDPRYRNFLEDGLNYLKWTRWTARIGEDSGFPATNTNKGQAVNYALDDVVQYEVHGQTRFYRCIQAHSLQEPSPEGNAYWELLTWNNGGKISYLPPDDVRFDVGSFYYEREMGLLAAAGNLVVDAGADQAAFTPAGTLELEGNAYHPTNSISNYQWTQLTGPTVSLSGANGQVLSLNNPGAGEYSFELAATAGGNTGRDTVHVLVEAPLIPPVADAGTDINLPLTATSTNLDGSGSSDADGQVIAYNWHLVQANQHPQESVFVNFTTSGIQAPAPWNNMNGTTTSGTQLTALEDENGATTTIGLELLDNWGGTNTQGMTTGNNSGIFPDVVMEASYWFQTDVHQVRIFGLQPNELYNLECFGSRNGGGNRTTVYRIGEQEVSLDAAYNDTASVELKWVAADANGELLLEISKAGGASYGYLNALVIKQTGLEITNPNTPNASISGLQAGSYTLQLQVLDDDCQASTDEVVINVGTGSNTTEIANVEIQIAPNPTADRIQIQTSQTLNEVQLKLMNLHGQVLSEQQFPVFNTQQLSLANFPAGMYFIQIQTNNKLLTIPVIKK